VFTGRYARNPYVTQVKHGKNNWHLSLRIIYISDTALLNSAYNEKCVKKNCRENQNQHFSNNTFLSENRTVCEIMWEVLYSRTGYT
jgi:hypothetical protein